MENLEQKQHRVLIMCGLPGSGKSSLAATFGCPIISRDAIRFAMLKEGEDYFSHENEVLEKFYDSIWDSVQNNYTTIIDATHLTPKARNSVLVHVPKDTYRIAVCFDVPVKVAIERNANRTGRARVPENVIYNMATSYVKPTFKENFDEIWTIDKDLNVKEEKCNG